MNESHDLPTLTHSSSTPDTSSCSLISIIPNLGMSSCRGRAEAFARSLSSKLRTLGSQSEDDCAVHSEAEEPIGNGEIVETTVVDTVDGAVDVVKAVSKSWVCNEVYCEETNNVTDRQPLRHDAESFFDFDCELESPGSPADECEYLRLIETASNTPHNSVGESGYGFTSTPSSTSSTDGPYYDVINADENLLKDENCKQNGTLSSTEHEQNQLTDTNDTTSTIQHEEIIDDVPQQSLQKIEDEEIVTKVEKEVIEIIVLSGNLVNGHHEEDLKISSITTELELNEINNVNYNNSSSNENNEHDDGIFVTELNENHTEIEVIKTEKQVVDLKTELLTTTEAKLEEETCEKRKDSFTHSGLDTTDDEDECRPQRVRRCSSLKTGKTPPGTPGRKKIVRFADKLGLDLADIKTFLDEIPNIPKSAFEDLEINDQEPPIQLGSKTDKLLVPLFQQPGGLPTFLDLVRERQVSLENAAVTDHINQTITGSVRVRNLDFHKSVHIRYTLDHWRSYADLQANYVENSCDGFSDIFTFFLFGNSMQVGQRLEFAVRFQCKGQQFWDNNYGINYCFQCLPANNNNPISTLNIANNHIHHHHHHNNNNNHNHNINLNSHSNRMSKQQNGRDQEHTQSQVLRLLSPAGGDAWCSSFY